MDKESILRLGLDFIKNIDLDKSDELYDPSTNNHIIKLILYKDDHIYCPHCGLITNFEIRSSVVQKINHYSSLENNNIIKFYRRIFKCECGKTFREPNPFTESKRKNTVQREVKILYALKDINKSFSDVADEFNLSVTLLVIDFNSFNN